MTPDDLIAATGTDGHDWILTVGCGDGTDARAAARHAVHGHVLCLDASPRALARAARHGDAANLRYRLGDIETCELPEGDFDVAVTRLRPGAFADPVAAYRNIARALAPMGTLVIAGDGDPASLEEVLGLAGFGPVWVSGGERDGVTVAVRR
ncbi:hypothetical protein Afil01_49100 [Actinorhabdospora filicis]|uniref:Methyltransferase domain-containing protein n=1 Tax=Actinorhabdospora filicis TaxID=1785913 RepID=A0A9W6SPR1_9ACTN|nr:class I SAM-dependent methyltransferase [Actinorhabdospora filicis]GLZ80103.1 hypothetical protein Afil01_49100 [Actinorhabdospora filicis]